jgi:hypothetical protein
MLRRILKWSGWTVLALVCLAAGLLALALAINARDEPPSADSRRLSVIPANPYATGENLYVALAGFDAPAGASIISTGAARIAAELAALDPELPNLRPPRTVPAAAPALTFAGNLDVCPPLERGCSIYADVTGKGPAIEKLLIDNAELQARYRALRGARGYFETAPPSTMMLPHFPEAATRKLFLADVAHRVRSPQPAAAQAALADLTGDLELWGLLLRGQGALVGKMVALAYLQGDLLLLADIVADPDAPLPAQDPAVAVPLGAAADFDIGDAFAWEFRVQAAMMRELVSPAAASYFLSMQTQPEGWSAAHWRSLNGRLGLQFLKPQATENLFAQLMTQLMQASSPTPGALARLARLPVDSSVDPANLWSIRLSYNPIGKILVAIAAPAYPSYVRRAGDVFALQRLVHLGYEIRYQRVPPAAVRGFMQVHPEWATHPSDGHAFALREERREIDIVPLQPSAQRRYFVRIWHPSGSVPAAHP